MVTQEEEFLDMRREVEELGQGKAKDRVVDYQKCLYARDLEGDLRFYAQNKGGIPTGEIQTVVDRKNIYCTLLSRNLIDKRAWRVVKATEDIEPGYPITIFYSEMCFNEKKSLFVW